MGLMRPLEFRWTVKELNFQELTGMKVMLSGVEPINGLLQNLSIYKLAKWASPGGSSNALIQVKISLLGRGDIKYGTLSS